VVGVKSLKSQGCSSEGGEIRPSFFKSERKTKMWLIDVCRGGRGCDATKASSAGHLKSSGLFEHRQIKQQKEILVSECE
jgi:hypothetical protein